MTYNRYANSDPDILAGDLDDACWEDYEAVGLKPGAGGKMVPNCVPVKSAGGLSERDENAEFEALAGGPEKAFRMMRLWERAEQAASGNRYTLGEQVDPVAVFVSAARRDRFSDKAIQYYVEEIQGSRLPKKWKALRASVPVKSAAWKVDADFMQDAAGGAASDVDLALAYADCWPLKTIKNMIGEARVLAAVKEYKSFFDIKSPRAVERLEADWFEISLPLRDLSFRSKKWVSPADWAATMKEVSPRYNAFSVTKVAKLLLAPEASGIQVQGARESSVCLYVKGPPEALAWLDANHRKMAADESHIEHGELRLWWD